MLQIREAATKNRQIRRHRKTETDKWSGKQTFRETNITLGSEAAAEKVKQSEK